MQFATAAACGRQQGVKVDYTTTPRAVPTNSNYASISTPVVATEVMTAAPGGGVAALVDSSLATGAPSAGGRVKVRWRVSRHLAHIVVLLERRVRASMNATATRPSDSAAANMFGLSAPAVAARTASGVAVAVGNGVCVLVGVTAPVVVGVVEGEALPVIIAVGVLDPVHAPVNVALPVGVNEGVAVSVVVPVDVTLSVDVPVSVALPVGVIEDVAEPVIVPVSVTLPVDVSVCVALPVGVIEDVAEPVIVPV